MTAAARRNPDSTLILLGERDLIVIAPPPAPPRPPQTARNPPIKQGIRAVRSAGESGVVRFTAEASPRHELPANDPPPATAEDSGPLDTSVLRLEPPRSPGRTDALNVALLVMTIAMASAVASAVIHLAAMQ